MTETLVLKLGKMAKICQRKTDRQMDIQQVKENTIHRYPSRSSSKQIVHPSRSFKPMREGDGA
jgi:hypothetical protein